MDVAIAAGAAAVVFGVVGLLAGVVLLSVFRKRGPAAGVTPPLTDADAVRFLKYQAQAKAQEGKDKAELDRVNAFFGQLAGVPAPPAPAPPKPAATAPASAPAAAA